HQVGLERVLEQHRHGAVRLEVPRCDGMALPGFRDDDIAQSALQVGEVAGQAENGHDLGGYGNVEPVFADGAVALVQGDDDVAQGAVVHVHDTAPTDLHGVDVQGVAPFDVVIDQGREQIIGQTDGVHVTGEMQVQIFHGDDLRVPTTSRATLHAENRAQTGLTQADRGFLPDPVEGVAQAHAGGGLAFAGRRRADA